MQEHSITPDLLVPEDRAEALREASLGFASLTLSKRQMCDLELLISGGFAPLDGFMDRVTYESVLTDTRLPGGGVWPLPITLDVSEAFAEKVAPGQQIALRDPEGFMPAVMTVTDIWRPGKQAEAQAVFGTRSGSHPGVRHLLEQEGPVYLGGRVEGIQLPAHHDFESLWDTPEELKHLFRKMGWRRVLAVHSSNPMHRLEREVILQIAKDQQAHILLHPAVGVTKPGDLHYYARVHCYKALRRRFPHDMAALSLLPLAMRMAGPKEALWHAIVNRNFGATHFMVGPDHASPPASGGDGFYGKYEAQEYVAGFAEEIGIEPVPVREHAYVPQRGRFMADVDIEQQGLEARAMNSREFMNRLIRDQEIPEWFSYPEVIEELRRVYPPRSRQGITLFFTGLSGSGKSTLANIVFAKLIEAGSRPVSLLDGDIVRQNLSSELGFSKAHRDINIRRIGFVASEITKNRGVAICAPIAPYAETRAAVRNMIEPHGAFIEIHVSTPLEVCEGRDRKGLYAKARKGIIPEFTGISDPYDVPQNPEIRIDTSQFAPAEAAQSIMLYLLKEGYLDESA
jgi:sulfate adenylyltransferase